MLKILNAALSCTHEILVISDSPQDQNNCCSTYFGKNISFYTINYKHQRQRVKNAITTGVQAAQGDYILILLQMK